MDIQQVEIFSITVNDNVQQRVQLDEKIIFEYTEFIETGGQFPPLKVFDDGQNLILADGRHRYEAYLLVEVDMVPVEIMKGTERDAILYAVGANADHGLRRSNADKRHAVKTMLKDEEWGQWSDGTIAQKVHVSQAFVSKIRRELTQNGFEFPSKRISRNGRTIETTNIGSRNNGSDSGQGVSGEEPFVDRNNSDEGPPADGENSSRAARENFSASETEGNGSDEETQNNLEGHEDDGRDVTSAARQEDSDEGIGSEEEDMGATTTETSDEVTENASTEEDEGTTSESIREIADEDQGESASNDAENSGQEESTEPESSSPVQTESVAELRHQILLLEQTVQEREDQIRFKDQRIAELEEEVENLKETIEYYESEIMAS